MTDQISKQTNFESDTMFDGKQRTRFSREHGQWTDEFGDCPNSLRGLEDWDALGEFPSREELLKMKGDKK